MKQIIKMAFLEGITVKEARERFSAVQNSVARRGHLSPSTPPGSIPTYHDSNTQAIATLQEQIKALQLEMKTLKEVSIPTIQAETKNLAKDLAITNATVGSFEEKLDSIASSQKIVATQQADRFDKIDLLLNKLTLALTPSHLTHLQTNLNSTASQMSPMPAPSHMGDQWEDHLLNPSAPWANTSSELILHTNG
jgi:TolA-binding protein